MHHFWQYLPFLHLHIFDKKKNDFFLSYNLRILSGKLYLAQAMLVLKKMQLCWMSGCIFLNKKGSGSEI